MVLYKEFRTIQSKIRKFKPNLNRDSYGIYAALTNCESKYIGQTKIYFSI